MDDSTPLNNTTFLTKNTEVYRHGAKIRNDQILRLVESFVNRVPIVDAAAAAVVHRDTARDIYGALRNRLWGARFNKWVEADYKETWITDEEHASELEKYRNVLFRCHENTECKKRYRVGRRKKLACRACPIRDVVDWHDPDTETQSSDTEIMVHMIFDIQDFYRDLGWHESLNSGVSKREIFDIRSRHFEISATALGYTRFDIRDDRIKSNADDFLSLPHLFKTLVDELIERPL